MAAAVSKVPERFQDWIQADLVAAVQQDAIPRDVTFDAERCEELAVSEKSRYFEKQKTRTFAEFWEQREAGKANSGVKAKEENKTKKPRKTDTNPKKAIPQPKSKGRNFRCFAFLSVARNNSRTSKA